MPSHKSFTPRFKSVGDDGTASWVMATLNVIDSDGDVSLPGSFGKQSALILPAHDRWHVPLGKASVYEDGEDVVAEARFNLDIPAARDWHSAIKFDFENPPALQEYSYGYDLHPGGWKTGEFQGQQVRFFQPKADGSPGVEVFETSPVLKGAGVGTRTLAAKSGLKFVENIEAVLADLDSLHSRASEVVALRAEKGKALAPESADALSRIADAAKRFEALLQPEDDTGDVDALYAQSLALIQGAI